jgi:comEA protein
MHYNKSIYHNIYTLNNGVSCIIKQVFPILLALVTLLFSPSCIQRQRQEIFETEQRLNSAAVNINKASEQELNKLPGIGEDLAQRIIEYREKNGNFRRTEHLLLVRGISEKKFRQISSLVKTQ